MVLDYECAGQVLCCKGLLKALCALMFSCRQYISHF